MKMKYFKIVCVNDRVIVTLNADKDKYLNYKTSTNGDTIGHASERCHDSERLNFFRLPKKFKITKGGIARTDFAKLIVFKENASLRVIVENDGQVLSHSAGNTLPIYKSYRHLSGISIQRKVNRRRAYSCTNVIHYILSQFWNYYLCKNNVVIHREISHW